MAKELYVGHISEQATEEDLRKLFSLMGPVTSVHLIVDQQTGEFKRCAYVRMLSEVNLNEVVETLDGTYLIDRCIVVSIAKPQKERTPSTTVRRKPQGAARPATAGNDGGNARPAGAKSPARSSRPAAANDSAKTGRSSAARESAKPARPATSRDAARSERPAPADRTPKSGRPAGGKRSGDTPRPPSKGRR
ncbi:MAG: hypothetical protein A2X82_10500 [Geobacteraceae bacterium GWC2_55_20]|nr:MAG: hypothetical protein A2X82_10500 [Geobacteraceae bacterium GWC2_55_20]OGU22042.1 MAG: hypothetical protein A2X85_03845 [Geobacteraceae bacterium GWF2_54_21]HCE66838.1 RNA-binding protein [Geobacter sp.]